MGLRDQHQSRPWHGRSPAPLAHPSQSKGAWLSKQLQRHWYGLALLALFSLSLGLRLWGLDRFNQLVFDEIYYVRYAVNYLRGEALFDAHPPLGKYLIALGIWLGQSLQAHSPFWSSSGTGASNALAGMTLSPYSYRWLNAVVGSCIPLLVAGLARQLSQRRSSGLLAGGLVALDGFLLVESRFALLHVYLVAFGLLGNWCWLKALRAQPGERSPWLLNAGLSFGACIAVKWNGLGYWAVPLVFWSTAWLPAWLQRQRWRSHAPLVPTGRASLIPGRSLHSQAVRLTPWQMSLYLIALPLLVYFLLWLPHLRLNPGVGLGELHGQILGFHRGEAVIGNDAHRYCSPWWSWPLMIRPIAYGFSQVATPPTYFAVHGFGNPLLWWGTSLAVGLGFWGCLRRPRWFRDRAQASGGLSEASLWGYLLLGMGLNWLPWAAVGRCTFLYHYLGSLCFGVVALAWWLERALQLGGKARGELTDLEQAGFSPDWDLEWRYGAIAVLVLITVAFLFWLPIYLGLALSPAAYSWRMLLPSWI